MRLSFIHCTHNILKNVVWKLGQLNSDNRREFNVHSIIINSINFVSKATVHAVTVCDFYAICYMQNRSNIGYINVRKISVVFIVHALNARQQSYNLFHMCAVPRVCRSSRPHCLKVSACAYGQNSAGIQCK